MKLHQLVDDSVDKLEKMEEKMQLKYKKLIKKMENPTKVNETIQQQFAKCAKEIRDLTNEEKVLTRIVEVVENAYVVSLICFN